MVIFTNYLQLGERLTQIWINKYTLILILAIIKLLFFSNSLKYALSSSESYILSNCSTIDKLYSNITNDTPHYLGLMGNYMIEKAMEETVKATLETLSLLVYASEELLTFVIDLYLGTYACLITSAVDGTVEVATNATEKIISSVNGTIHTIADELDDGLNDLSKVINKIISAATKVEDFFTDDDDDDDTSSQVAKVNLTISALRNVYIPSSINDKLEELSEKTPSFDTLKNSTKNKISVPFEYVRSEIKSINSTKLFSNTTLLYVPPITDVTSNGTGICSSNKEEIQDVYNNLTKAVRFITTTFTIIMAVLAVCVLIPVAYEEYRKWLKLQELKQQYVSKDAYFEVDEMSDISTINESSVYKSSDIISSYQAVFNRWQTRVANIFMYLLTLGNRLPQTSLQRAKLEWVLAYITSERALIVLGIGLLAVFVCICQLIMLSVLKSKIEKDNGSSFLIKGSNITSSDTFNRDMTRWGTQTNSYINITESYINDEAFGWINKTTTSVNNTVSLMIYDIDETLADIFNGTLLYKPMRTVVKCVIEDKLYAVEKAMTWINEKAQVDIPRINITEIQDSLQYETQSPVSKFSSTVSDLAEEMKNALLKILHTFEKTTMTELYISFGILSLWAVQIPIALLILVFKQQRLQ